MLITNKGNGLIPFCIFHFSSILKTKVVKNDPILVNTKHFHKKPYPTLNKICSIIYISWTFCYDFIKMTQFSLVIASYNILSVNDIRANDRTVAKNCIELCNWNNSVHTVSYSITKTFTIEYIVKDIAVLNS